MRVIQQDQGRLRKYVGIQGVRDKVGNRDAPHLKIKAEVVDCQQQKLREEISMLAKNDAINS